MAGGTALVAGDFALTAGWDASTHAVGGYDSRWQLTVTAAGAPSADPTFTLTFKDGSWTTAPWCFAWLQSSTDASAKDQTLWIVSTFPTATAVRFQFNYQPVAGSVYVFEGTTTGRV